MDKGATQNSQTLVLDVDQRKWEGEENEERGQQKISRGNLVQLVLSRAFPSHSSNVPLPEGL